MNFSGLMFEAVHYEVSEGSDGRLRVDAGDNSIEVDRVFASIGRIPNVDKLGLDTIGAPIGRHGVPVYDP